MTDDSESVLVKLTRMEGKLDLSNLRHDQHDARFATIDHRLGGHGERITKIESRETERRGERAALAMSGRILWTAIGLIPGGAIVAALMRLLGL